MKLPMIKRGKNGNKAILVPGWLWLHRLLRGRPDKWLARGSSAHQDGNMKTQTSVLASVTLFLASCATSPAHKGSAMKSVGEQQRKPSSYVSCEKTAGSLPSPDRKAGQSDVGIPI